MINRREFLKIAAAGGAVLVAPGLGRDQDPPVTIAHVARDYSLHWLDDRTADLEVVRWSRLPEWFTPNGGDVFVPLPPSVDEPDSWFYAGTDPDAWYTLDTPELMADGGGF